MHSTRTETEKDGPFSKPAKLPSANSIPCSECRAPWTWTSLCSVPGFQLLRGRSHRVAGGVRQSVNAGPNPNPREGAPEKNIKKNYKKSQPLPPAPSLPPSLPLNRPVVEQNPSRSRRRNTPRTPEPRESGERKDPVLFPPSCCAGW